MSDEIAKNVPNFIPMAQGGGRRPKPKEEVAELDAEGNPINPHIPQFISKAPWYLDSGAKASLAHQRIGNTQEDNLKRDWYRRGERVGPAATKYRKGACENCGASSHRTKDCLERPRKIGAKWNGRDIQADEVVQEVQSSWDSKRDRSNGYDFDTHAASLQETFDRVEALRAAQGQVNDEAENVDEANPQSVADQTKSTSNSHMRIREDIAGYLTKGTDADAYDPKTRRLKETIPSAGTTIDKEGFTRASSDVAAFDKMQTFAWTQKQKHNGGEASQVHLQAAPSRTAILYKQQEETRAAKQSGMLAKYGDDTQPLPQHLLETAENQQEYTKDGKLVTPVIKVLSIYQEDVFINGHSTVWGSWYDRSTRRWGYQCCRNILKNAYCTAHA